MRKRVFAGMVIGVVSIVVLGFIVLGQNPLSSGTNNRFSKNETPLPIPPILEDKNPSPEKGEYHLTAQRSFMEFANGLKTETYGYNGPYLGPVIRVKKGEEVSIKIKNSLDESTTVHWHGMEIPGEMDGGPYNGIQPGEVWNPQFTINQPAATLWFHPHPVHKTGEQVYKGLAGLVYIDDEVSEKLDIPKDYGENDFPIIIQDRRFDQEGRMPYKLGMMDVMHGMQGETVLINGAINPLLEVPQGKVRFRILNGSNARIYYLNLTNSQTFWQIATDGGFLEKPVKGNQIELGPAERVEWIVDFSKYKSGDVVDLLDNEESIMKFKVSDKLGKKMDMPETLTTMDKIPVSKASTTKTFVFQGMGRMVNINGKQMDMGRIDEEVSLGATEIWEISNPPMEMMGGRGGMAHPFHAHGVQFQILDRDGKQPAENERGWKDTILVHSGETVRAIATFKHKGIFMYHCHILEHEDSGMMGQFRVQ